ncbi:MAG: hypothetical protein CMO55_28680 [Verrucomicrobiales bacterium]|nr:hypothetical protein [Verrucomicrobiales bacterium]
MPTETWFPIFVFYEDIEFSPEVKKGAVEAIEEHIEWEVFETRGAITASTATNRFHHDPRIRDLIAEMQPGFEKCFYEDLKIDPEKVRIFIGRCWPVIQINNGDSGIKHFHRGGTFSCVVYLDVPDGAGSLEFFKPTNLVCDGLPKKELTPLTFTSANYPAKEGRMVLFPSEIEHRRMRNKGEGEGKRLAIAMDIYTSSEIDHYEAGRPHLEYCIPLSELSK